MKAALVANGQISKIYDVVPTRLDLPNGSHVEGVAVGWQSADGAYKLLAVTPFTPPANRTAAGDPSYAYANDAVTETYATVPTPLNVIPFATFISRWLDAEYTLLLQKRAAAITAGAAQISLVRQWDMAMAMGSVDLNSAAAENFKAAIVTASILTQARADVIFS